MKCFYRQNKKGTPWVDRVSNDMGWTVDFKMKVDEIPIAGAEPTMPVSLSFCLDVSGSMDGDRIEQLKMSMISLVDLMENELDLNNQVFLNSEISIITFSSSTSIILPVSKIKEIDFVNLRDSINSITTGGGTNMYDGLYRSYNEMLDNSSLPAAQRYILVISDGQDDQAIAFADEANDLAAIYTVGIGVIENGTSEQILKYLSNNTGGIYYGLYDESDIESVDKIIIDVFGIVFKYVSRLSIDYYNRGLYLNDGVHFENICFDEQEIFFVFSKKRVIYDTTSFSSYRISCKGDLLVLFAKKDNELNFVKLAEINLETKSNIISNIVSMDSVTDDDEVTHISFSDDNNVNGGQIFYVNIDVNGSISEIEPILRNPNSSYNPSIELINGEVYIAFVSQRVDESNIEIVHKTGSGWSDPVSPDFLSTSSYNIVIRRNHLNDIVACWLEEESQNIDLYFSTFSVASQSWSSPSLLFNSGIQIRSFDISVFSSFLFICYEVYNVDGQTALFLSKVDDLTGELDFTQVINIDTSNEMMNEFHPSLSINDLGDICVAYVASEGTSESERVMIVLFDNDLNLIESFDGIPLFGEHRTFSPQSSFMSQDNRFAVGFLSESDSGSDGNVHLSFSLLFIEQDISNETSDEYILNYKPVNFKEHVEIESFNIPKDVKSTLPILYRYIINNDDNIYNTNIDLGYALYKDSDEGVLFYEEYNVIYFVFHNDITGNKPRKEIRFGDYSGVMDCNYSFSYLRCYLKDAVDPSLIQVIDNNLSYQTIDFTVNDISVDNYGNVFIGGDCGVFYYINKENGLIFSGENGEIELSVESPIVSISKSYNNEIFIATANDIYYSRKHFRCFNKITVIGGITEIRKIYVDSQNRLLIADDKILKIVDISSLPSIVIEDAEISASVLMSYDIGSEISCIAESDSNMYWIGTIDGLYFINNGGIKKFTTIDGLISNHINDIAIRDAGTRYIATNVGISEMVGYSFRKRISSFTGDLWNDNVSSVMWQDPNILWASTMNYINQILVDDISDVYYTNVYNTTPVNNDYSVYYVDVNGENLTDENYFEVYINNNRISNGYDVGIDSDNKLLIHFYCSLNHSDQVSVIIRSGVSQIANLSLLGSSQEDVAIKDVFVDNDQIIYAATSGSKNQIQVSGGVSQMPYDSVFLDMTPPVGKIEYDNLLENRKVRLSISGEDLDESGSPGSGLHKMIVSDYPNFTSDGVTPLDPVPFQSVYDFNLGLVIGDRETINIQNGKSILYVSEIGILFYITNDPASVFYFDNANHEWINADFSLPVDAVAEFVVFYNDALFIAIGFESGNSGFLYKYKVSYSDGQIAEIDYLPEISEFEENRILSYEVMNGFLYIGTGSDVGGYIYRYSFEGLKKISGQVDGNIYSITGVISDNRLIANVGDNGEIYSFFPESETFIIEYKTSGKFLSGDTYVINNKNLIFVGNNSGYIYRSATDKSSYNISFRTESKNIRKLKSYQFENESLLFAAVGDTLYKMDQFGSWVWEYSHPEEILDFDIEISTRNIHVLSESKLTTVYKNIVSKNIYLKLIDRAGNESILYSEDGEFIEDMFTSVSIQDIIKYVNVNRIMEISTDTGEDVFNFSLSGGSGFYSARKIEYEKGIYISEVFDGMADLVRWDSIGWKGNEPTGTSILLYVRASDNKDDIYTKGWGSAFSSDDMPLDLSDEGSIGIGFMSRRYVQFKIELISEVKGLSPSIMSILLKSITSSSSHFYTTNFVLPDRIKKGILTSEKILPVSADIVFGLNTTDSVDWNDYQILDEDRLFNVNQIGKNLRVGIKFLSPDISATIDVSEMEYSEDVYQNFVPFSYTNLSSELQEINFEVLIKDAYSQDFILFSRNSSDIQLGFYVSGEPISDRGVTVLPLESITGHFIVPSTANILCDEIYLVDVFAIIDGSDREPIVEDKNYRTLCDSTFINDIYFDFTNTIGIDSFFDFRVAFYSDYNRSVKIATMYSGNGYMDWSVENKEFTEDGVEILNLESVKVHLDPNDNNIIDNKMYYLVIDVYDHQSGNFINPIYSYSFRRIPNGVALSSDDVNVPIVKNFGLMFELDNQQFIKVNI